MCVGGPSGVHSAIPPHCLIWYRHSANAWIVIPIPPILSHKSHAKALLKDIISGKKCTPSSDRKWCFILNSAIVFFWIPPPFWLSGTASRLSEKRHSELRPSDKAHSAIPPSGNPPPTPLKFKTCQKRPVLYDFRVFYKDQSNIRKKYVPPFSS